MLPTMVVVLDGAEPVEYQATAADMWLWEDLSQKSIGTGAEYGLRLTLAYIGVTGKEPKNLAEGRSWARENMVHVDVGKNVVPIEPDPSGD
jgi:hypothetical protein